MPETPRTWTLGVAPSGGPIRVIGDLDRGEIVEVIEEAAVEPAHAAEGDRMLDLIGLALTRLETGEGPSNLRQLLTAKLREYGRLSGGEGA